MKAEEAVTPSSLQRGEEEHVTDAGQQINKPKTKLVENMSVSVLPVGTSGECASVCILTSNRLRGVQTTLM